MELSKGWRDVSSKGGSEESVGCRFQTSDEAVEVGEGVDLCLSFQLSENSRFVGNLEGVAELWRDGRMCQRERRRTWTRTKKLTHIEDHSNQHLSRGSLTRLSRESTSDSNDGSNSCESDIQLQDVLELRSSLITEKREKGKKGQIDAKGEEKEKKRLRTNLFSRSSVRTTGRKRSAAPVKICRIKGEKVSSAKPGERTLGRRRQTHLTRSVRPNDPKPRLEEILPDGRIESSCRGEV